MYRTERSLCSGVEREVIELRSHGFDHRETIRLCDSVRESAGVDQPEADRELRDLIESTLAGTELVETVQAVSPIVETVTRPIRWKHRAAVAASLAGIVAIANEAQNQFH